jgi:hypothetical protein
MSLFFHTWQLVKTIGFDLLTAVIMKNMFWRSLLPKNWWYRASFEMFTVVLYRYNATVLGEWFLMWWRITSHHIQGSRCLVRIPTLEDERIMMFWNGGNSLPSDAASYPRRMDTFFKVQDGGNKFFWSICAYLTETSGVLSQQMVTFTPVLVLKFTKSLTFKWSGWYIYVYICNKPTNALFGQILLIRRVAPTCFDVYTRVYPKYFRLVPPSIQHLW